MEILLIWKNFCTKITKCITWRIPTTRSKGNTKIIIAKWNLSEAQHDNQRKKGCNGTSLIIQQPNYFSKRKKLNTEELYNKLNGFPTPMIFIFTHSIKINQPQIALEMWRTINDEGSATVFLLSFQVPRCSQMIEHHLSIVNFLVKISSSLAARFQNIYRFIPMKFLKP